MPLDGQGCAPGWKKKIHGPAEAYWVTARFTIAYVVIFISSPGFYSVEFSGAVPSFLLFL